MFKIIQITMALTLLYSSISAADSFDSDLKKARDAQSNYDAGTVNSAGIKLYVYDGGYIIANPTKADKKITGGSIRFKNGRDGEFKIDTSVIKSRTLINIKNKNVTVDSTVKNLEGE